MNRVLTHGRFFLDYVRANLLIALEYRATFVGQVVGMLVNDVMWIVFWGIYFTRFQVLGEGWTVTDVFTLWAVAAVGFGLTVACCGNLMRLGTIISTGDLDYYLALPKNVL